MTADLKDTPNRKKRNPMPGSLFCQPWWLDAVAPASWDEVIIQEGGRIVGRLPYVMRRNRGQLYLTMPPLTQTLGPWIRPYEGKPVNRVKYEKRVLNELIKNLPEFSHFAQNFHHSITNWLPFYWKGFSQTTRYTYLINDMSDLDRLWLSLSKKVRWSIRKARKELIVLEDSNIDSCLDLAEMVFARQGRALPYDRDLAKRIDKACSDFECGKHFLAQDSRGRQHAVVFIVWDDNTAYYLISGADPELRSSEATSLLLWEAIKFSSKVTKSFDFEGSMIEPVERQFRSFGAEQVPYFRVSKTKSIRIRAANDIRSWWSLIRGQR